MASAGLPAPGYVETSNTVKLILQRRARQMDFDREYDLENAGIDAFDFSLMNDDERAETLLDAGLDPDDYAGVEFDSSFDARY